MRFNGAQEAKYAALVLRKALSRNWSEKEGGYRIQRPSSRERFGQGTFVSRPAASYGACDPFGKLGSSRGVPRGHNSAPKQGNCLVGAGLE